MRKRTTLVKVKPLRIVVFQEGDWLCAQFVDFDLSAQARTLAGLYRALHKLTFGHIELRRRYKQEPFTGLPSAPAKYRTMFEQSKIELPSQIIPPRRGIVLPKPEVRVAVASPAA